MSIKVYLVDDHTILRDGLRLLLGTEPDIEVVGEADNGRDAIEEVRRTQPDVVIIDIAMPEMNGIDTAQQIGEDCPQVHMVMLSMYSSAEHIFRSLQVGARGYLLKDSAGTEVVAAVRAVHAGRIYLSTQISDIVSDHYMRQQGAPDSPSPLERLTLREREVLQLVVEGRSSAEIAQRLSLSAKTVDTYRSRMMQKLEIKDIPSLVKFAIQHGLTPLS